METALSFLMAVAAPIDSALKAVQASILADEE
jgi:hypothetical protein